MSNPVGNGDPDRVRKVDTAAKALFEYHHGGSGGHGAIWNALPEVRKDYFRNQVDVVFKAVNE